MSFALRHRRTTAPLVVACLVVTLGLSACSSSKSASTVGEAEPTCEQTPATPPTTVAKYAGTGAAGKVIVTGTPLAPVPGKGKDPAVGCAAPIIDGQSFEGDPTRIGGVSDKPTLVVVAAHWCPHCNVEVPKIVDWVDSTSIEDQVDLIVLSTGFSRDAENYPPRSWLGMTMKWDGAVLADDGKSTARDALGVGSYPSFVLIDTKGKVVARLSGEQEISDLQALVDDVRSGSGS